MNTSFLLKYKGAKLFMREGLFILFVLCNVVFFAPSARAGVWGEALGAELLGQTIETIKFQIQGAILGTLKVTAIEMLNSKVAQLVGGSSAGGALFITDWGDFLYDTPAQQTSLYMNDFFTLTTRGKYASANYVGIGDGMSGVAGNYVQYLVARSQSSIQEFSLELEQELPFQYNLDEYSDNPDALFQEGDWRGFNAFFSNPMNNPFGFELVAQGVYAERLARAQEEQRTKATSSGFVGPEENGRTIAPAAAIEAMTTNVQNIGNDLIAAAENPGEFLSGVVGALVNKTVTSLVQRGVGEVQKNIQKEIRNVDNQIVGALNDANRSLGPAAQFTSEVSQRTDIYVKPYTVPPPPANESDGGGG